MMWHMQKYLAFHPVEWMLRRAGILLALGEIDSWKLRRVACKILSRSE